MSTTPIRLRPMAMMLFAVCLASASISVAQEFRASIIGEVTDPSGAPVPGAVVTAFEHSTNQTYTAKSNADGVYSIDFVQPGQCTVMVEAQGFTRKAYPDVTLEAGQKLNLNVTLSLGSVRQQVTVTASPGLLNTTNASSGGVVDQRKVENMPSTGHMVWDDLMFTQGVRELNPNPFNITPRNNASNTYSANGAPASGNAYFLNGAPVSTGPDWDFVPNQSAVQELQASVSAYDAEYGPAAGGTFNTVVKSGANSFHGELYDYHRNSALAAAEYSDNLFGLPKTLNIANTFGGAVGGPIQKNKTFFFGSYEGFRQLQPATVSDSVPTASMRNGDFTGSGYTIYDPSTVQCVRTSSAGCTTYGRAAFPRDAVPQGDINPVGAKIVNLYPMPNRPGVLHNYVVVAPQDYDYDQYIGRVDYEFSDTMRLSALFTEQKNHQIGPGNAFSAVGTTSNVPTSDDNNAIVDFTKTFSASLVGDFKASFGRYSTFTTTGAALQQSYSVPGLTMPFVSTTTHQNIAPAITVSGFTPIFGNTANGTVSNYWYLSPTFDQVKGRHTLNYGFEFMDIENGASGIPGTPNGSFTFGANWTQQNPLQAATGSGNSYADLLLGYPSTGSVGWNVNNFTAYHYYAGYLQDDFKVLRNVTLNLGLRWDVSTSPSERHNSINGPFCFTCTNPYSAQINRTKDPALPNPLTGGVTFAGVTAPRAPYNVPLTDWQPRLGIAWEINSKTVFRAGFGIFYPYANRGTTSTGFSESTSYVASLDGNVTPTNYFLAGKPYPSGALAPAGASGGLGTDAGNAITYYSPSGAIPWTQHWSAGFQRALPEQILLDVEYAGSHTHGLVVTQPWGVISSAEQAACFANNAICNTNVSNPFYGVLPAASSLGASKTVPAWELVRQQPLFNGVSEANDPLGYSVYNAMQVRVERKIRTLDFVLNYAYSNWMSADQYLNAGSFRDASLWYGPGPQDVRHYLSANAVWPLPLGQGGAFLQNTKGWLGGIVNHWLVSSTWVDWTGMPLSAPSAAFSGPGCTSYLSTSGQTRAHWFNNNVNCYQPLGPWQPRTSPLYLGYLRNPPFFEWDFGLQKRFALPRERMFLQFRGEATNASNSPQFGGPDNDVAHVPSFAPGVGETGFGTLPTGQEGNARSVTVSLKLIF
ncbi:MAG: carboxypeptidase regulatory-like domain-containing protein [Terriglobia bacterium]